MQEASRFTRGQIMNSSCVGEPATLNTDIFANIYRLEDSGPVKETLRDCFTSLKLTPSEFIDLHSNKVAKTNDYDNLIYPYLQTDKTTYFQKMQ